MFWVYVLRSQRGRYYIGSTNNLKDRVRRHNSGLNKSTKADAPWTLVYKEKFLTRQEAYKKEMRMKRYKGGEAFKKLVK